MPVCLPRHRDSSAGGTRTHKHRLLRHVLRIGSQDVFKSNDRRSCDQRCTLLSHLSYTPEESSGGGGARTHNPRVKNHVLQSAVGHVSAATKLWPEDLLSYRGSGDPGRESDPRPRARWRVLLPCTPNRQSPLYPNAQRRVAKSVVYYGRPYRRPSRRLLTGSFVFRRLQRHSLASRPASLP